MKRSTLLALTLFRAVTLVTESESIKIRVKSAGLKISSLDGVKNLSGPDDLYCYSLVIASSSMSKTSSFSPVSNDSDSFYFFIYS